MSAQVCAVTGNIKNILGQNVTDCVVTASVPKPFFHTIAESWISGAPLSVTSDSSGNISLSLIETETQSNKFNLLFNYSTGNGTRLRKSYAVTIPNQAAVDIGALIS